MTKTNYKRIRPFPSQPWPKKPNTRLESEGQAAASQTPAQPPAITPEEPPKPTPSAKLSQKWELDEIDYEEIGVGHRILTEKRSYVGDWKKDIVKHLAQDDVDGMKRKAAPLSQLKMIELALDSDDERISLDANKFILSQTGHGAINRVEHSMQYDGMPTDQLAAMVKSAMQRIGKHNPALLARLSATSPQIIDAQFDAASSENDAPSENNDAQLFHDQVYNPNDEVE